MNAEHFRVLTALSVSLDRIEAHMVAIKKGQEVESRFLKGIVEFNEAASSSIAKLTGVVSELDKHVQEMTEHAIEGVDRLGIRTRAVELKIMGGNGHDRR